MYDILKAITASFDWVFDYGRSDFHNLFNKAEEQNKVHIFLDPVEIKANKNETGETESFSYSGSFMVLYSSDIDEISYEERYEKYIKPNIDGAIKTIENLLSCQYEATFLNWSIIEIVNILDYNFDGIICNFNIEVNTDIIEQFSEVFTVTTEAGSGGSIYPQYTEEEIESGLVVPISVVPEVGSVIDEILVNGNEQTINPFNIAINKNYRIIASFISGGLMQKLKTFIVAPILRGCKYFFGDYSTYDNDVKVGSVRVGQFGTNAYLQYPPYSEIDVTVNELYVKWIGVYGSGITLFSFSTLNTTGQILIIGTTLFFYFSPTKVMQSTQAAPAVGEFCTIECYVNATTGERWIKKNGISYITNAGTSPIPYILPAANTIAKICANYNGGQTGDNKVAYCLAQVNGGTILESILNHGQGVNISNLQDPTGATDGTVVGAVLSTFWGSTSDDAFPYDIILGATLYKNDSDSTIMPICVDTSVVKAGFTRLGYFPAASGILKGLPNKYYISGVDAIIAEGWYTADQIAAFTTSANLELEQTAYTVTSLIVNE